MRKILLTALVLVIASLSFAGQSAIQTATLCFTNETVAKGDTIQAADSIWHVLDQRFNGGLADHIAIYLPDVLASGDSLAINLELLGENKGSPRAVNVNSLIQADGLSENVDAPYSTDAAVSVYGYLTLDESWKYGDGACVVTWSPPDSAICNRVKLVIYEIASTGNTVQLTGCDSLSTSTIRCVWSKEED